MLQIPKKIDYAVQLLRYLAKQESGTTVSLRDVSNTLDIPFLFLQRIAQELKQQGYIGATRGAHGGYYLVRDLSTTTVQDIMNLLGEQLETVPCVHSETNCHKATHCEVKHIWKEVHTNMQHIFSTTYVLQ